MHTNIKHTQKRTCKNKGAVRKPVSISIVICFVFMMVLFGREMQVKANTPKQGNDTINLSQICEVRGVEASLDASTRLLHY